jgi:hypothetical protein
MQSAGTWRSAIGRAPSRDPNDWDVLDVQDGALLKPDWHAVVVPAPA